MAALIRSISMKIFGISLGLLVMLVLTAIWSAQASWIVNGQLRTMSASLFPLTVTLADMREVARAQHTTARFLVETPDRRAVAKCLAEANAQGKAAERLGREADRYHEIGARIALVERNRLQLARIEPMIAELRHQQRRLHAMTVRACQLDASPAEMFAAQNQSRDVERLADGISRDLSNFVERSSRAVRDDQTSALQANAVTITFASAIGLMLAWLVARGMTRPILRLQAGARAVSAGNLDAAHVPVTSRDEIGDVTRTFNAMVADLFEKERIKETFGQYVDPRVVSGLIEGSAYSSGGEKQIATIYFSDIVGFTGLGERLAPATLVDLINAYFTEMSEPIRTHSGIIDKYIGDAIMAFWVPPFADPATQARVACEALLEQRARLDDFRAKVPDLIGLRRDVPSVDFRAALATGEVVVGSIGSSAARSFTIMGDSVNFCSRLEAANKLYGTSILIDEVTFNMAGDAIVAREIDQIAVAGKTEAVRIFELAAMAGEDVDGCRELHELYRQGLGYYRAGAWEDAAARFDAALASHPGDGPSQTMLRRIAALRAVAPDSWDGIWRPASK